MKKVGLIAALVALVLVAASLVALVFLSRSSSHPFADPADARCNAPSVTFDSAVVLPTHREFGVRFTCVGAQLAGTLNVPLGRGPFPAVVWVHGAGESARLPYDGAPLVQALVDSGIAVLSYDKRGVGESEGECCPGDYGQFNLLAADVDGAVAALRSRPEIDPSRIGLLGASQAGWVVPLAAVRSNGRVAFTALVDAPAVSTGEEDLYSQETGEQGSLLRLASFVRTAGGLRTPGAGRLRSAHVPGATRDARPLALRRRRPLPADRRRRRRSQSAQGERQGLPCSRVSASRPRPARRPPNRPPCSS